MQHTDEQKAFFAEVNKDHGNILLESVAGSGKTTSIVEALDYIDDASPVICCSFTKLAASQLENKINAKGFKNVTSTTLNALGWKVCRANVRGCQMDANKTVNILRFQIDQMQLDVDRKGLMKSIQGPVKRIIGLLKGYLVRPNDGPAPNLSDRIDEIAEYHGIDLPEGSSREAIFARKNFNMIVERVYRHSVDCTSMMDFDDQKFFPVYFKWSMPKYAVAIIDECQDCNTCDIEMIRLLNTRTIWVGDTMQAIYLFRGSLLNAMDLIEKQFKCVRMTLSVCWRCADEILLEAQKINPLIKSPVPNPKGKGSVADCTTPEFLEQVAVGDYVICRTTAPLVKRCLQLVRKGKPAKVKGREVGRSLLLLIDKINAENGGKLAVMDFVIALLEYKTRTVANLEAANREEAAIRVQDECESLEFFCMEARTLDEVANKIDSLFTDSEDDDAVVLLLTGHKSKGLERDRVWFLRPDLCPFPKAKSPHEQEAERRLRYVILTRAALERIHVQKEKDEK